MPGQVSRRQAPIDGARRLLLPRRAEPCPEGRKAFVQLRRRVADQLLQRRRARDHDEAVPEAARRFEALGDRPRRLLPEAADAIDRPRPPAQDQLRRLDPAVLHLRSVGRDPQQDDDFGSSADGLQRALDAGHEGRVVGDVVIAREHHDRIRRRHRSETRHGVQNRRRRPAILRLRDDRARWSVRERRQVEALVVAGHYREEALGRDQHSRASACLLQQGVIADQPAELLGPPVARQPARQRGEPRAVAAGQDDPGVRAHRSPPCWKRGSSVVIAITSSRSCTSIGHHQPSAGFVRAASSAS